MTRATQIAILDANNARCKEIMISKSNDYANEDVLSNFKLVAKLEGSTPIKDIFGHIANKTVRLGNLLGSGKSPLNESVSDSASDLINYLHLLTMAIQEEAHLNAKTPLTPDQCFDASDLYTSSQNENFDNFLKGPVDPYTDENGSIINNTILQLNADDERLKNPPKTVFEFPKSKIDKNDPFAIPADYDKFTEDEKADFLFDYTSTKRGKYVNVDVNCHMTLNKKTKNAIIEKMDVSGCSNVDVKRYYKKDYTPEAVTVNHISQPDKTKLAHEKKSGILSGFDQNGCGRV